jgi:hypothetical protein
MLARGRGGHVFTASGERELKGLPDPVPVCIVGWDPPEVTAAPVPFPARLLPQGVLPFSGRDPQLDALTHAWKEAAAGDRRVVLVSGEPGIGKTRLASEVARRAHDLGAAVLFGRCDEDMGVPFQPFVDALEHVVHAGAADRLGRHANELVRLVPDVAQLVSGLEPPLSADPETERYRLFDAVAAWLAALSDPGGVVLVLDDLHWAEKPTLLLLRHLIRSSDSMRLLVVGTYRDTDLDRTHPLSEVLADLRREPGVERLALSGLDVEGIGELLANASGERMDVQAAELAQLLWSETEGNPFFVQEIIRSLVESGRIVQREGVWTTDFDLDELGIPEGVREVIGRRLTRLSDAANNALAAASVIGAVVDVEVLIEVSGMNEDAVLDALDEAAAASLLRETTSGTYEFTHALVRSTLYDELSAARRSRRHRQVAEALEARTEHDMAALAYHFGRAGTVDDRAVDYARAAGEMAMDRLAFDQAVTFFSQALEGVDDGDRDDAFRCSLSIQLGTAQRLAGIPAYRETLLDAAQLAQRIGDARLMAEAALALDRGFWSTTGESDPERIAALEAALQAVGPEDSVMRARLLAVLATEREWSDPELERFAMGDEAVAMALRLGDDATIAATATARQVSSAVPHRMADLVAGIPELISCAERSGDPQLLAFACTWGLLNACEMGDFEQGEILLRRMEQITEEINTPVLRWLTGLYQACTHMVHGTGDDVEQLAGEVLAIGQGSGQPDAFMFFAAQLFWARLAQGRVGEVLDLLRQQRAANPGLPTWGAGLALALQRVGSTDESAALVDEIMAAPGDPLPYDRVWLLGHSCLGEAVAVVGTPEQALRQYRVLSPYEDRMTFMGTAAHHAIVLTLAMLAARFGDDDRAARHFVAAERYHERINAPIWLSRTRLEWGRFLLGSEPDRALPLLQSARELADRMGAVDVRDAAAELLASV